MMTLDRCFHLPNWINIPIFCCLFSLISEWHLTFMSLKLIHSMAIIFWMRRCQWFFIRSLNEFSMVFDSYDDRETSFVSTPQIRSVNLWEVLIFGRLSIDIMHICSLDRLWSLKWRERYEKKNVYFNGLYIDCWSWRWLSISFSPLSIERLVAATGFLVFWLH